MGKFDFDAFEAADSKVKAEEQAQIDAKAAEQAEAQPVAPIESPVTPQAAPIEQPDPNAPAPPQLAPQDAQGAVTTQPEPVAEEKPDGFDINAFLGEDEQEEVPQDGGAVLSKGSLDIGAAASRAIETLKKKSDPERIAKLEKAEQEKQAAEDVGREKQERTVRRMRAVLTEGPRLVGSVVGGMVAGPPGAAALGGAGDLLGQSAELLVGDKQGKEDASQKEFGELAKEMFKQSGKAGTEEGLYDLAGGAVAKTAGLVFSPVIKKIAPRASAFANVFRKLGGKFSPAELDKRGFLRFLESASRNSLEGKELFKAFVDEPADRAIVKMSKMIAGDLADGIGKLEPDVIADTLAGTLKGIDTSFDEVFSPAWSQLDDLTKAAKVSTAGLKDFAEEQIFKMDGIEKLVGTPELEKILDGVDILPNEVSFSQMRRIKAGLIKKVKSLVMSGDAADGVTKRLAGLAEEALLDPKSVSGASKEARMLHANLKHAYKTGKTAFKEAFPKAIIDGLDNPRTKAAALKKLFPDNAIDNIKNVRNTLSTTLRGKPNPQGKKTWNKLQRLWFEDLVTKSTDSAGKISSKKLEAAITKFGPSSVKEILGPERARSLRLIRGISKAKQAKKANLTFLVRSLQISGAITATGGLPGDEPTGVRIAGGAIALTPGLFALLSGNRTGNALLRAGVKLPKGSKLLPGIIIKLNALARRERAKEKEKSKSTPKTKRPTVAPSPELQV